jgi:integrase
VAGQAYRELIAEHADNPLAATLHVDQAATNAELMEKMNLPLGQLGDRTTQLRLVKALVDGDKYLNSILDRRGIALDSDELAKIRRAVASGMQQGHETLARFAKGDYRADPNADRFPPLDSPPNETLTIKMLFDIYNGETKVSPATEKRWIGVLRAFMQFCGHDDVRRVTEDDVLRWKAHLLASGRSNRTIGDVYLASFKAVCNYALRNKLLPSNPAAGVTITQTKRVKKRERGFTETEALTILAATLVPASERTSVEFAAARRWVPWLCAYSGARVNEITQMRAIDLHVVRSEGHDVHCMNITPEAGTVKNGEARDVALHPHLIEMGFLDYVKTRRGRHLFYDPGRYRSGKTGNPHYKKVGEKLAAWVRGIGVDDPNVQPNHGWRHRFKSMSRGKIDADIRDRIQGHALRTEGEEYGDLWAWTMFEQVSKLPKYDVAKLASLVATAS